MTNYVEYNDKIAFHPGYYIKEIVENLGITQEDFAKRLDTTPKNISLIIRGEQRLSTDMAMKLSNMLGTSVNYWLNLQNAYDAALAEIEAVEDLEKDKTILRLLGYDYFEQHFNLPHLPRQLELQVKELRKFLGVANLQVLQGRDFAVNFRGNTTSMDRANIIKANAMVQIATNMALQTKAPKFNKVKFEDAVEKALNLTQEHEIFLPIVTESFKNAGVILQILPNLKGSKINGATKKIGSRILLMVNDRRRYADTFWFTLMHEIGHIMNGDYGISVEGQKGKCEDLADRYAQDKLIDPDMYEIFVKWSDFSERAIRKFAKQINRDPGIILGRLESDGYVGYNNWSLKSLKTKYKVLSECG